MNKFKSLLRQMGVYTFTTYIYHKFQRLLRFIFRIDHNMINSYLAKPGFKKLHLGCGDHPLDGWLNSDLYPKHDDVFINAVEHFAIPDNQFDYIYSEHMIEHISWKDCQKMFTECFRVLKPGGMIRLSTPDLKFLIELYGPLKSDVQINYMDWSVGKSIKDVRTYGDTFVINKFMHSWGHTFIYDKKTLELALKQAGFTNVNEQEIGRSEDVELKGLEYTDRLPAGFIELESLIMEASKPATLQVNSMEEH